MVDAVDETDKPGDLVAGVLSPLADARGEDGEPLCQILVAGREAQGEVNPFEPQESTSGDPSPGPKSASGLTPAMVALSFTTILIQVQAAAKGGVRDLLPILIAGLLVRQPHLAL